MKRRPDSLMYSEAQAWPAAQGEARSFRIGQATRRELVTPAQMVCSPQNASCYFNLGPFANGEEGFMQDDDSSVSPITTGERDGLSPVQQYHGDGRCGQGAEWGSATESD